MRNIHKPKVSVPLVIVEWVDSAYSIGWLTHHDDAEPQIKKCCSVGWVRRRTKEAITLTANLTLEDNPHRCCEISIPTKAVLRIHELK